MDPNIPSGATTPFPSAQGGGESGAPSEWPPQHPSWPRAWPPDGARQGTPPFAIARTPDEGASGGGNGNGSGGGNGARNASGLPAASAPTVPSGYANANNPPFGDWPGSPPALPAQAHPVRPAYSAYAPYPDAPAFTPYPQPTGQLGSPYGVGDYAPPIGASTAFGMPSQGRRRGWWPVVLLVVLALLFGGVAGGTITRLVDGSSASGTPATNASATGPHVTISSTTTTLEQDTMAIATAVEPSVVKVTALVSGGESIGSGDILDTHGDIVTNDHVVQGGSSLTVMLANGTTYNATLIGEAPQEDLAVIKITAPNLTPIGIADSSQVKVGQFAIAVGNPLDQGEAATLGTISALNGSASEQPDGPAGTLTGLLQTTAPINPGNSGGALVNLQGKLIGMPTLEEYNPNTHDTAGLGYAIASNRITFVANQLIKSGHVASSGQGFLGIEGQPVDPMVAANYGLSVQSGVLIQGFVADSGGTSPARDAGLRTGDVITAVNGKPSGDYNALSSLIDAAAPGTKVTLTVVRGASTLTITVTLGQRPTSAP